MQALSHTKMKTVKIFYALVSDFFTFESLNPWLVVHFGTSCCDVLLWVDVKDPWETLNPQ